MKHHIALPPGAMGKISYIAPAGQYSLQVSKCYLKDLLLHFFYITSFDDLLLFMQDTVLELEFQGIKKEFTMLHVKHFIPS